MVPIRSPWARGIKRLRARVRQGTLRIVSYLLDGFMAGQPPVTSESDESE
jgi:hypothetical protein